MTAGDMPPAEDPLDSRQAVQDSRLAGSMSGLAALAPGDLPLRELLTRVAGYAVQAIPGADGAGLTLLEQDRPDTMVATADFVRAVDAVQYGLGEGPCILAAREDRTVLSGSLGDDPRWGTFGTRVAQLGVHSVVSPPLRQGDKVVGAMNVYAHGHEVFDARAASLGEAFAVPAAVTVQHAHVLEHTRRLAEQLQASLATRMVVEQAMGVLVGRHLDPTSARQRLDDLALERDEPVEVVARALVDEAARRATRHGPAEP